MKKIFNILVIFISSLFPFLGNSQNSSFPNYFSWSNRFNTQQNVLNYISPAKDQIVQGPCAAFAATALLEATIQIYFNVPVSDTEMDLSEQYIFSSCNYPDASPGALSSTNALDIIINNGIGEEDCFPYPDNFICVDSDSCSIPVTCGICNPSEICCKDVYLYYGNCNDMGNCSEDASFPFYDVYSNISVDTLKNLLINKGPIMAYLPVFQLHEQTLGHSLLIVGWQIINNEQYWIIKDSWPGAEQIRTVSNDYILNSNGTKYFYAVRYINGQDKIRCNKFSENDRNFTDNDGDGFYYWGIGPKPAGCPGPCKMDFNDADPTTIFLDDNYIPLPTPVLDCPDYACSAGDTSRLKNIPPGINVSWSVSPSIYFNSPTSGNDSVAVLYPKTMYTGSTGTITFTITDDCSSINYQKSFTINKPEYQGISINVVPSYAPDPILFNEVWLLCRNSTYYIYLNNSSGCSTTAYQWSIPAGWTLYEQTGNYIRINTNETPSAMLTVSATTCCNTNHLIKTQYFGESYSCGGYLMVYPNPATSEFNIEFDDTFDLKTVDKTTTLEIYDPDYSRKYFAEKFEKRIKIKTDGWKRGHYYIIFNHKGQRYYERIAIEN